MRRDVTTHIPRTAVWTVLLLSAATVGCRGPDKGSQNGPARERAKAKTPAPARTRPAPPPLTRLRARPRARPRARTVTPPSRPSPYKACATPPKNMKCIRGGPFWRGNDKRGRNERPRAQVVVSTFYLDAHEITNPVFERCVNLGLCKRPKNFRRYRGYHGQTQPAVPVSWYNALKTCLLLGKRLPTEAEWEKGARTTDGRTYPWGNERPRCSRAHYRGCKPAITKPVGSFAANPYGLFDMAGNGYEWVLDWASACYQGCRRACGAACAGRDPRGPCQGKMQCKGHRLRVLRGGSWYWSANHMRTSWRRAEYPRSGGHRLSFRCATRDPKPRPRTKAQVQRIMRSLRTKPLAL